MTRILVMKFCEACDKVTKHDYEEKNCAVCARKDKDNDRDNDRSKGQRA